MVLADSSANLFKTAITQILDSTCVYDEDEQFQFKHDQLLIIYETIVKKITASPSEHSLLPESLIPEIQEAVKFIEEQIEKILSNKKSFINKFNRVEPTEAEIKSAIVKFFQAKVRFISDELGTIESFINELDLKLRKELITTKAQSNIEDRKAGITSSFKERLIKEKIAVNEALIADNMNQYISAEIARYEASIDPTNQSLIDIFRQKLAEIDGPIILNHESGPSNVAEHAMVGFGVLSVEESRLFNYQELNTYAACFAYDAEQIKWLFYVAKNLYANDPDKGLSELAEISYLKVHNIKDVKIVNLLFAKIITIKEFDNLNDVEINQLTAKSSYLLKKSLIETCGLTKRQALVINLSNKDAAFAYYGHVKKVFDNFDGDLKAKQAAARAIYNQLRKISNISEFLTLLSFTIKAHDIANAPCFNNGKELVTEIIAIVKEANSKVLREGHNQNAAELAAQRMFAQIKEVDNIHQLNTFLKFNIDLRQIIKSKGFDDKYISELSYNYLQYKFENTAGTDIQKELAAHAAFTNLKGNRCYLTLIKHNYKIKGARDTLGKIINLYISPKTISTVFIFL